MENKFYGSKLNTVLLLVLIILMIVVLWVMFQNRELYLHPFAQNQGQATADKNLPEISGNQNDLVFLSILPRQKVSGVINLTGSVKNSYFFEGNIIINLLDQDQKLVKAGQGTATTEWTTAGPVSFKATVDFSNLPKGLAYLQIHNDNASGLPENDKSILIPVTVE